MNYITKFNQDCRYFKGVMPCNFHKESGIDCPDCKHYSKWDKKFLIIKQGEIGDVLRTTPLVRAIKEKHPKAYIVWLVQDQAHQCIIRNKYIDEVVIYHPSILQRFLIEEYDEVICLDKDVASTTVATLVKAKKKLGFGMNADGKVYPFNKEAEYKWATGNSDNLNRKNKKSYQEQIFDITGYRPKNTDYIFSLSDKSKRHDHLIRYMYSIPKDIIIIGLNTGVGNKFQPRKWPVKYYAKLAKLISDFCKKEKIEVRILALGGKAEYEGRSKKIRDLVGHLGGDIIVPYPCDLEDFFGTLNICDIVVTSNTMAMHVAIALKKKMVVFMGPIIKTEIDTYGLGPILTSKEHKCLGCFKDTCDLTYQCMDAVKPEMAFEEVKKHIKEIKK